MSLPVIGSQWWNWETGERVVVVELTAGEETPSELDYVSVGPIPPEKALQNGHLGDTWWIRNFPSMFVPCDASKAWEVPGH